MGQKNAGHNGGPNYIKGLFVVALTLGGAHLAYDFGNFNDAPGQFIDYENPRHAFEAPIGDIQWAADNVQTVMNLGNKALGAVGNIIF